MYCLFDAEYDDIGLCWGRTGGPRIQFYSPMEATKYASSYREMVTEGDDILVLDVGADEFSKRPEVERIHGIICNISEVEAKKFGLGFYQRELSMCEWLVYLDSIVYMTNCHITRKDESVINIADIISGKVPVSEIHSVECIGVYSKAGFPKHKKLNPIRRFKAVGDSRSMEIRFSLHDGGFVYGGITIEVPLEYSFVHVDIDCRYGVFHKKLRRYLLMLNKELQSLSIGEERRIPYGEWDL